MVSYTKLQVHRFIIIIIIIITYSVIVVFMVYYITLHTSHNYMVTYYMASLSLYWCIKFPSTKPYFSIC